MKITIEHSTINMSLELNGNPANYADQLQSIIASITSGAIRKPKSEDFEVHSTENLLSGMIVGLRSLGDDNLMMNSVLSNPEYLILSKVESVTEDKDNKQTIIVTEHGTFSPCYRTKALVLYNEALLSLTTQN